MPSRTLCRLLIVIFAISIGLADKFAIDLISQVNTLSKRNFVISPWLISQALGQLYLAGSADRELAKLLYFSHDAPSQAIKNYAQHHDNALGSNFRLANQLYISTKLTLSNEFEQLSRNMKINVTQVEFNGDKETATNIDTWISQQLSRKLRHLIQLNDVSDSGDLLSVSGMYFSGIWRNEFTSEWKDPFNAARPHGPSAIVYVQTMFATGKFQTFHEQNAQGIFIPLRNSKIGMLVLLPKIGKSPKQILQNLDKYHNFTLDPPRQLNLFIPKFRTRFATGMKRILRRLGVHQLFKGKDYEETFSTDQLVRVNDLRHVSIVDIKPVRSLILIEEPEEQDSVNFKVDRPFAFLIKDDQKIYAAGRIEGEENFMQSRTWRATASESNKNSELEN